MTDVKPVRERWVAQWAELFDEVVVAVVNLPIRKGRTLFDIEERLARLEPELS